MSQILKDKYGTYEEQNLGKAETVTAFAGGGQGSATALTLKWNIVTTCASDNDSVKLLAANIGLRQVVFNNTAKLLAIYPQSGEKINGITNLQYVLPPSQSVSFECNNTGDTLTYIGSNVYRLKASLTAAQIKTANSDPIDIGLPASGAGYYYRATAFDAKLTFGTVAFTSQTLLISSTSTIASDSDQASWGYLNSATNFFSSGIVAGVSVSGSNIVENDTLSILADTDSTVGDSTIDCYIIVERVKL